MRINRCAFFVSSRVRSLFTQTLQSMQTFRDFISSETSEKPHYLVIGHPIGHTLSPPMHRAALRHHQLEGDYFAIDLLPQELTDFISWTGKPAFRGANITIPYKRELLTLVDRLDPSAQAVGALNTLVRDREEIVGYNTDVDGFRYPLEPYRDQLKGESVIVFGTGGASLAVERALEQLQVEQIVKVSRHPERFESSNGLLCNYNNWQDLAEESVMLVNTTPLGMAPDLPGSPVKDHEASLLTGKICYDLIYNPLKTRFLAQAEEAGAVTIGGLEMFIGQGNRAFELWTGHTFPMDIVYPLLQERLNPKMV